MLQQGLLYLMPWKGFGLIGFFVGHDDCLLLLLSE
jgi:hypothetical protein